MRILRRFWPLWLLGAALAAAILWGALAPLRSDSREKLFAIPDGTFKRRMAGDKVDILPPTITLTLGVRDVLLLRNDDSVPQQFGPVLIMPGQSFRLPFEQESENQFDCAAHVSGKMTVLVEAPPAPGFARLRWRWRELTGKST
ncbi:MAG: hypothetical protein ABIT83_08665 [Massilia sp.]